MSIARYACEKAPLQLRKSVHAVSRFHGYDAYAFSRRYIRRARASVEKTVLKLCVHPGMPSKLRKQIVKKCGDFAAVCMADHRLIRCYGASLILKVKILHESSKF